MTTAIPQSVELMLIPYLAARVSAPVSVDPEIEFNPPMLVVERVAGAHDGFRIDRPVVDIDAFAATRQGAESLAWEADTAILALEGTVQRGLVVTRVEVEQSPRYQTYGNRNLRRFIATYQLTIHAA